MGILEESSPLSLYDWIESQPKQLSDDSVTLALLLLICDADNGVSVLSY